MVLTASSGWTPAQTAQVPPAIPAAKTVFVVNAGETENILNEQAYAMLSQEIAQAGHYKVVLDPSVADLVLELHYLRQPDIASNGSSGYLFSFRLVVSDRASHVPLWTVTEPLDTEAFKGGFDQRFHASFAFAVQRLGQDVRLLSLGQLPSTNGMDPRAH